MDKVYEAVIGLEIHAQLLTQTKIFCGCSAQFGSEANADTCPVCLGMPGALPVFNKKVLEMAAKAATALNLQINNKSIFARKNYFYPDLPKGYQISQYDEPFSKNGWVEILTSPRDDQGRPIEWKKKRFNITRLHLEEDAGKSLHEGMLESDTKSYVNLNRSGVPLAEIVSEPDFRSSWEAYDYVQYLRKTLIYVGVCDGNMEEGSLRCDANVSVRPVGQEKLGTKTEIKNLNSFRFLQKALDYEIARQIKVLKEGGRISQETRLWNEREGRTYVMRSKEEAHDYRYFPEPDLAPIVVSSQYLAEIAKELPELPEPRRERLQQEYKLSLEESIILTQSRQMADYYEEVVKNSSNAKMSANWVLSELLGELKNANLEITACPIKPADLGELVNLIIDNTISGKMAKEVFEKMFQSGKSPKVLVEELGLIQITDTTEIQNIAAKVIDENPKQLEQYCKGKQSLIGFFVGQVMKLTAGKANPQMVNEILKNLLEERCKSNA
ncbi:MAG: Asp-tRNA(Asn)/Glu-tRNA(Gln) amidotransferase subunit GatB [Blastocatellia bacterium]|nr:Asp-tRNA(Asn)/Glu-tRNA(Gln) amidotransferase subunit GatB [Blastocatellia bacterium]MBL8196832.1 Asp-tRNA(Asn)/Glu-tRNA(Gln) amidotransferase subunit GatB [Blastocatellia bacterium]